MLTVMLSNMQADAGLFFLPGHTRIFTGLSLLDALSTNDGGLEEPWQRYCHILDNSLWRSGAFSLSTSVMQRRP
jgi:hypothetical protein